MPWYWPFGRKQNADPFGAPVYLKRVARAVLGESGQRRFDVADIGSDAEARWCRKDSRTVNQILQMQLRTLHEQCAYEVRNNPIVDGTIGTHARDVVGADGPKIQIVSGASDNWVNRAERVIQEWSEEATADGRSSLADWLRDDIRDWWQIGDMLTQIVEPSRIESGVRMRLHPLDARGLAYDLHRENTILGVERDEYRAPIRYYITEVEEQWGYRRVEPKVVPAQDILHDFTPLERGQARGFPLMTQALGVINELREYDTTVLRAAKVQALMSVLMTTVDETIEPEEDPADFEIRDGGITRMPSGWKGQALQSSQPGQHNTEFRSERMRELGSPVGMPLLKIKHDASGHNYSSARFDAGDYQRANTCIQSWLFRRRVKPVVKQVLVDAMLRGVLEVRSLRNLQMTASWEPPPHADPVKEAMAAKIRMEARISSPIQECRGDFEQLCAEWRRANELLEAHGMPPMLGPIPGTLTDLENYLNEDPDDGANTENRPNQQQES